MTTLSKEKLQIIIDQAWDDRAQITNQNASSELRSSVLQVFEGLNLGEIRVATR